MISLADNPLLPWSPRKCGGPGQEGARLRTYSYAVCQPICPALPQSAYNVAVSRLGGVVVGYKNNPIWDPKLYELLLCRFVNNKTEPVYVAKYLDDMIIGVKGQSSLDAFCRKDRTVFFGNRTFTIR